jgi:hypothetical protein
MGDKRKFKIGQLVKVNLNQQAIADYDEGDRKVMRKVDWEGYKKEQDDLVLAKITGVKTFQTGTYHAGSRGGYEYEAEPAYFTPDKNVNVWAVRLGYRNKELYFFEADITPFDHKGIEIVTFKQIKDSASNDSLDIPWFWNGGFPDNYRKQMSRESKDWPRDERGRWSK